MCRYKDIEIFCNKNVLPWRFSTNFVRRFFFEKSGIIIKKKRERLGGLHYISYRLCKQMYAFLFHILHFFYKGRIWSEFEIYLFRITLQETCMKKSLSIFPKILGENNIKTIYLYRCQFSIRKTKYFGVRAKYFL